MTDSLLPDSLAEIRDGFLELPESDRLMLLLEFSNELPALPSKYDGHPELAERVVECQSPVYIIVDLDVRRFMSEASRVPAIEAAADAGVGDDATTAATG